MSLADKVDNEIRETLNIEDIKSLDMSNSKSVNFINELRRTNINIDKLNTDDINYISFKNSEVKILSIATDNPDNKIIAYEYNGKYLLLKSSKSKGFFNVKTIDGNDFIKVIGNEKTPLEYIENSSINSFSNYVYSEHITAHKNSSSNARVEACCRNYDYTGCVNCTVDGNGLVWVLISAVAPEVNVAIMISCIGAGPDAWC